MIFVAFMRWAFCPWFALMFPSLEGLSLPFELEVFYCEHILAAFIGPTLLILGGRYGKFNESFWMIVK